MATIDDRYERNLKQPVFADQEKMTKQQAEKTNTIIQSMYNEFLTATEQPEITSIEPWQVTMRANTNVGEYHSLCYEQYCTISCYFRTTGYSAGDRAVAFRIKKGTILSGGIVFCGINSLSKPTDYLNNYGYFDFSYNAVTQEYYIMFVFYEDPPNVSWLVSMSFMYQAG